MENGLILMEREEALDWYLNSRLQYYNILNLSRDTDYDLIAEPPSAMFCKEFHMTVVAIENPDKPLDVKVKSLLKPVWTKAALNILEGLERYNIKLEDVARGGGPYETNVQPKRESRWIKQRATLKHEAVDFWRCEEWKETVRELTIQLLQRYCDKALQILDLVTQLPEAQRVELLVADKPEDTGTGWPEDLSTRIKFAKSCVIHKTTIKDVVTRWYAALIEAVRNWPEKGGKIRVAGSFKGTAGVRSDVDFEIELDGTWIATAGARSVGTDPSSVLFTKKTADKAWQKETWELANDEYSVAPWQVAEMAEIPLSWPATLEGNTKQVMITFDFGYSQNTHSVTPGGVLKIGTEKDAFGADNILFSSIFLVTLVQRVYALLISGSPFTQRIYDVTVGRILTAFARSQGWTSVQFRMFKVGDDYHILIDKDLLATFLARFKPIMRLKGMKLMEGMSIHFFLGIYIVRFLDRPDFVVMFMTPRPAKSVTSAKAATGQYRITWSDRSGDHELVTLKDFHPKIGQEYKIETPPEALMAAAETAERYPAFLFFEGSVAEAKSIITRDFIKSRLDFAHNAGTAEWVLDDASYDVEPILITHGKAPIVTENPPKQEEKLEEAASPGVPEQSVEPKTTSKELVPENLPEDIVKNEIQKPVEGEAAQSAAENRAPDGDLGVPKEKLTEPGKRNLLIYGFPTTGKTICATHLKQDGCHVLDCDDISKQALVAVGMTGKRPWHQPESPEYKEFMITYDKLFTAALQAENWDAIFTNSWQYFVDTNTHPDLAFVRTNAELVNKLASGRGDSDPMPTDVVTAWLADLPKIEKAVGSFIVLDDGVFMEDKVRETLNMEPRRLITEEKKDAEEKE